MRAVTLLLVFLSGALLAGCVEEGDVGPTETTNEDLTVYADDRIKIETIQEAAIEAPTLESPPNWQLGEWWHVELTDRFVDNTVRAYAVVAGAEEESFLMGMPTHDFSNDLMVIHVPGFGQIDKTDLSWEVHDCDFQPLQFPLTVDSTWQTQFECRDVTATVLSVDGMKATVELIGNNDHITLVYDAQMRGIVEMDLAGYAYYKILDHGFDFDDDFPAMEGLVTVPHMHDVIFMHGRIGGAVWFMPGSPAAGLGPYPPFDTVHVDTTYDRVSFVMILGAAGLPTDDALPGGYYREIATAPDGTAYDQTLLPTDAAKLALYVFKHDKPGGDWEFEHHAAGVGIAMSEGIAYHVYDVEIATGRILPSIGEHQHGSGEGH